VGVFKGEEENLIGEIPILKQPASNIIEPIPNAAVQAFV